MLASLLPGLRDVRTPLTVGYLWLFIGWAAFGDHLPAKRPAGHGLIARLFDLHGIFGTAATAVALSLTAYLLGAMLVIPLEIKPVDALLMLARRTTREAGTTDVEYEALLKNANDRYYGVFGASVGDSVVTEYDRAIRGGHPDLLRTRLLAANQEMYGEFDRLAAEASFRVNMFLPLLGLAVVTATNLSLFLAALPCAVAVVLAIQGANRYSQSVSVLRRAVLAEVIVHPAVSLARQAEQLVREQAKEDETMLARRRQEERDNQEADERSQRILDWQQRRNPPG
jgi:hypothetical protein